MTDTLPDRAGGRDLAAELADELEAARRRHDGRLPPERDLAARYGVSRTAVRAWLDGLERSGAVVRHVGRGTFVAPAAAAETSPAQIMAVRALLEPQLIALAVANATAADIAEMRRCLAMAREASDLAEFERYDSSLHTAIAEATGNRLLVRLFTIMNEARDEPVWGSAKRRTFTPERREAYQRDHEALVAAISDRDGPRAVAAMREHLARIRRALLSEDE